jgi:hypothetical protein
MAMKTSKLMKEVIVELGLKHGLDFEAVSAHVRINNPPYMPLVIEKIGKYRVSVAHYYEQWGDLVADPDVVFFTGYEDWVAIEITHPPPFGFHRYALLNDEGDKITHLNRAGQADLASFCVTWARNIREQCFLDVPVVEEEHENQG